MDQLQAWQKKQQLEMLRKLSKYELQHMVRDPVPVPVTGIVRISVLVSVPIPPPHFLTGADYDHAQQRAAAGRAAARGDHSAALHRVPKPEERRLWRRPRRVGDGLG